MLPNKSLKYNAFWNILSNVLNILLLFILTPIITKGLGDAQYGIYIILGTIGGALSIINLGLGEATLRYVAFYYSKMIMKVSTGYLMLHYGYTVCWES